MKTSIQLGIRATFTVNHIDVLYTCCGINMHHVRLPLSSKLFRPRCCSSSGMGKPSQPGRQGYGPMAHSVVLLRFSGVFGPPSVYCGCSSTPVFTEVTGHWIFLVCLAERMSHDPTTSTKGIAVLSFCVSRKSRLVKKTVTC